MSSLTSIELFWWATSYARTSMMSSRHHYILWSLARKNTTSCVSIRICSNLRIDARLGPVSVFSAAVPPLIRQFSTGFPQGFAQARIHAIPQEIHRFSTGFAHGFRMRNQQSNARAFSSAFSCDFREEVADASRKKKGEKQAESEICGKVGRVLAERTTRCGGGESAVHTECGTWNNLPRAERIRARAVPHPSCHPGA